MFREKHLGLRNTFERNLDNSQVLFNLDCKHERPYQLVTENRDGFHKQRFATENSKGNFLRREADMHAQACMAAACPSNGPTAGQKSFWRLAVAGDSTSILDTYQRRSASLCFPNRHIIWVKLNKSYPTRFVSQGKNIILDSPVARSIFKRKPKNVVFPPKHPFLSHMNQQ